MTNAEIIKYLHHTKSIIISKILFFIFGNELDKMLTILGGCTHMASTCSSSERLLVYVTLYLVPFLQGHSSCNNQNVLLNVSISFNKNMGDGRI